MMAIHVKYNEDSKKIYTESVYQYDKGQKLVFDGADLPNEYEVYFSNSKDHGLSFAVKGDSTGVSIPNGLFMSGEYVYAFLTNFKNEDGKATECMVIIPVIPRPAPVKDPKEEEIEETKDYTKYNVNGENLILQTNFDKLIKRGEEDE